MSDSNKHNNTSFLPNFCSAEALFIVVLSTELLAIILSLASPIYSRNFLFDLALNSLFVQWIALSCVGVLCLARRCITQLSELKAALLSFALILLVSLIITEIAWQFLYAQQEGINPVANMHGLFLLRSMAITAIVGAIVLRYLYVQHQWRKNIEASASARYQALQSRIRPHFLFNCMNTIASLTRKSPTLAEQSIEDLADLFRASLLESEATYKIADEWNLCQTYLRIEQHRLAERLNIIWDIDGLPDDALIPPLCLQPLIENMIYHGIERLPEGGSITIKGIFDGQQLIIDFINPIPQDDITDPHKGNKHAQENIQHRLNTLFNEQSKLVISHNNNEYKVTLSFLYQTS